jgi:hypothetical protein
LFLPAALAQTSLSTCRGSDKLVNLISDGEPGQVPAGWLRPPSQVATWLK